MITRPYTPQKHFIFVIFMRVGIIVLALEWILFTVNVLAKKRSCETNVFRRQTNNDQIIAAYANVIGHSNRFECIFLEVIKVLDLRYD
jgi:hypothetical protein